MSKIQCVIFMVPHGRSSTVRQVGESTNTTELKMNQRGSRQDTRFSRRAEFNCLYRDVMSLDFCIRWACVLMNRSQAAYLRCSFPFQAPIATRHPGQAIRPSSVC